MMNGGTPPVLKARLLATILAVVALGGLAGCSRTAPLQGKWQLDRAYTEAQFPRDKDSKGVLDMFITPVLNQMDGNTMTITNKVMWMERGGKALDYKVVDHPARNRWSLKTSDNEVSDYERVGDRLALTSTGGVTAIGGKPLKFYFKRVNR